MKFSNSSGQILRAAVFVSTTFLVIAPEAATLDTIGVTLLRTVTTNLDGSGIRVAQPEASLSTSSLVFEVNPGVVGLPVSRFTYHSTNGTSTNFPNSVGSESGHANAVGLQFFSPLQGVATNVAHVDNYEANFFIDSFVNPVLPPNPNARIVNQSFTFGPLSVPQQQLEDSAFDNAAAGHNTLFFSGADNSGVVKAPATSYNGLGVAAFGGASATGPTPDNGRSKPDITAPADVTSYSTPLVAGAAAVLLQAGLRGDGGSDTNAAGDMRTLKALLLNGALKPAGWTNGISTPLDARHGAGVLNVFNSYMQLTGGRHAVVELTSVNLLDPHPPGANTSNIPSPNGWDFNSLSSTMTKDRIHHYYFDYFDVTNARFTLTATLVWNRQQGQSAINDLDLFLYDTATSNLVAESISGVDNVEHLYVRNLPPGRYDLQVLKYGGTALNGRITADETYALAWEFFAMPLAISQSGANITLAWPIYPTGFTLQSTPGLNSPVNWSTVNIAPVVTNGTNRVELNLGGSNQFFRLQRP